MKMKKSLTKKLLVLLLCLSSFAPVLSAAKRPIPSEYHFAAPYSNIPDIPFED